MLSNLPLVIATLLFLCWLFYKWSTKTYNYWRKKGVPYVKPVPFFGNLTKFVFCQEHYMEYMNRIYKELDGEPFGGFFEMREPVLMVRDPKLILAITTKDFAFFPDREIPAIFELNRKRNPLLENIFIFKGDRWRDMRRNLTPVYTSGKLKTVISEEMLTCAEWTMEKLNQKGDVFEINCKNIYSDYIIDVVAVSSFGLKISTEDESCQDRSKFAQMGRKAFTIANYGCRFVLLAFHKNALEWTNSLSFPADVTEYFLNIFNETIKYRNESGIKRNDFFQLMQDSMSKQKDKYDNIDLAANAFVFFAAGYETTGNALSTGTVMLARNRHIQDKIREELKTILEKHNGCLNAEGLKEMTYLEMVVSEILRFSTPIPLFRECASDYKIPNTDVVIEAGTRVFITPDAVHFDPKYFPDPEKFDPERFNPENITKIEPGTYMPFGSGPRICIGLRFSKYLIKYILIKLLATYEFRTCERTQHYDNYIKGIALKIAADGVWVKFTKLKNEDIIKINKTT